MKYLALLLFFAAPLQGAIMTRLSLELDISMNSTSPLHPPLIQPNGIWEALVQQQQQQPIGLSPREDTWQHSGPDAAVDTVPPAKGDVLTWEEYKELFEKTYNEGEEDFRKEIFLENCRFIKEHNEKYAAGEVTYEQAVNQFSDKTEAELGQIFGAIEDDLSGFPTDNVTLKGSTPASFDWRKRGGVTAVKNQGSCGSCWTFSTVGTLETLNFKKTKKLVTLSEQQILDCCSNSRYGNMGCRGGWPNRAMQCIKDVGGLMASNDYPYRGLQYQCAFNNRKTVGHCSGYTRVQYEDHLAWYLAYQGTISICIAATNNFMNYRGGVFYDPNCRYSQINHAVLLVGFTSDYWIVKNSWGPHWGESGYIRMKRGYDMCGITKQAYIPN